MKVSRPTWVLSTEPLKSEQAFILSSFSNPYWPGMEVMPSGQFLTGLRQTRAVGSPVPIGMIQHLTLRLRAIQALSGFFQRLYGAPSLALPMEVCPKTFNAT
ncbi:MAG: hypothetical protein EA425_09455 [Puniceicoccaceae bacterium]|nr:MAG: hypothetical protein EA425_09455 [Puniceicoccaceae bacterium]